MPTKKKTLRERIQSGEVRRKPLRIDVEIPIGELKKVVSKGVYVTRSVDPTFAGKNVIECPYCGTPAHFASTGLHGDIYWCSNKTQHYEGNRIRMVCMRPFNEQTYYEVLEKKRLEALKPKKNVKGKRKTAGKKGAGKNEPEMSAFENAAWE